MGVVEVTPVCDRHHRKAERPNLKIVAFFEDPTTATHPVSLDCPDDTQVGDRHHRRRVMGEIPGVPNRDARFRPKGQNRRPLESRQL